MQRVFWLVMALVLAAADAASVVRGVEPGLLPGVISPERVGRGVASAASVAGIGITVSDLDRAVAFYTGVLDFTASPETALGGAEFERECGLAGARARRAELRLGDERIWLTQYLEPEGRAMPAESRSNDRWFQHIAVVVSDIDAAYARLRSHKVRHVSSGPQTLPETIPAAAGIRAFYFKDPDGHVLEIIQYPPEKGDPRWRRPSGGLFLGIDHTAIVVSDTDESTAFYGRAFGMRVAGESENFGSEQERLNGVFGARVRITALRGETGPGVELLEYLCPSDGRPMPADTRASDLWSWQIVVTTPGVAAPSPVARTADAELIGCDGGAAGVPALIHDPDGHVLRVHRAGDGR